MAKLREGSKESKGLEAELEALKRTQKSRKPLEEARAEYVQEEQRSPLPWEATGLTAHEMKKLARKKSRENAEYRRLVLMRSFSKVHTQS